jgi:hypothetical protein
MLVLVLAVTEEEGEHELQTCWVEQLCQQLLAQVLELLAGLSVVVAVMMMLMALKEEQKVLPVVVALLLEQQVVAGVWGLLQQMWVLLVLVLQPPLHPSCCHLLLSQTASQRSRAFSQAHWLPVLAALEVLLL